MLSLTHTESAPRTWPPECVCTAHNTAGPGAKVRALSTAAMQLMINGQGRSRASALHPLPSHRRSSRLSSQAMSKLLRERSRAGPWGWVRCLGGRLQTHQQEYQAPCKLQMWAAFALNGADTLVSAGQHNPTQAGRKLRPYCTLLKESPAAWVVILHPVKAGGISHPDTPAQPPNCSQAPASPHRGIPAVCSRDVTRTRLKQTLPGKTLIQGVERCFQWQCLL